MSPTVIKSCSSLVTPFGVTPSSTLSLSVIDKQPALRHTVELLHVFKQGREPAKVIREALSKALVPYYPLAGRLVESEGGERQLACTGHGVWFVEASADCSLHEVNYMQRPHLISSEDILPYPRPNDYPNPDPDSSPVMMQVTEFTCGGFTVSALFNHAVVDGIGMGQFLKAIGDIARGLIRPMVEPIWCRLDVPGPPKLPEGPPPITNSFHLEYSTLDLYPHQINQLRRQFTEETGKRCSKFDVLAAVIWRSRVRAIDVDPRIECMFGFPVDLRPLLHHVLPSKDGYYGNYVFNMNVVAPSRKIASASMVDIASLIKEAKERAPAEFSRWVRGELEEDPHQRTTLYESMVVTDLRRLGFSEMDFGWGTPMDSGIFRRSEHAPSCVISTVLSTPMQGVRILTRCVRREHLETFHKEMIDMIASCKPKSFSRL